MRAKGALATLVLACAATTISAAEMPTASPESVGMSSERLKRIDAAMLRQIDAGREEQLLAACSTSTGRNSQFFFAEALAEFSCDAGLAHAADR